ncbi:hypothetical protein EB796_011383 [Bugula neritina]|uniref:Uncharacterized protein n=1 Tax=Bugula neritina TaxID=10212 RepID=A0A7J7JWL1_BUGNE|nr:hypothetical protein EB796_011383 [Bugula neritina]
MGNIGSVGAYHLPVTNEIRIFIYCSKCHQPPVHSVTNRLSTVSPTTCPQYDQHAKCNFLQEYKIIVSHLLTE